MSINNFIPFVFDNGILVYPSFASMLGNIVLVNPNLPSLLDKKCLFTLTCPIAS